MKPAGHLIVISYDAFSEDHWEQAKRLPNLAKLIAGGMSTHKLRTIYPSLTYVVHSTISTGVYPARHGIYHNNPLQPFVEEKEQAWHWYRRDIKVPAIYDAAHEAGLKTAALLWPVSAKARIDYLLPEVVAIGKENQLLKVLRNGNPLYCISMQLRHGHIRNGIVQPELDDFTTACAVDTFKRKKPNLLMLHLIDLDETKHHHGTSGPEVDAAILRMDRRLGDIIEAVETSGLADDTVIMVLGDHGQINVHTKIHLNNLLRDAGLIYRNGDQAIWRAYVQEAGGASYLHIRDNDARTREQALRVIRDYMKDEMSGIEAIYDKAMLKKLHAADLAPYMLEAKNGYSFDDKLTDELHESIGGPGATYATHGYSPYKENYRTNLVINGKGIARGADLGEAEMVDIAPTMAAILGLKLDNCDGKSLI